VNSDSNTRWFPGKGGASASASTLLITASTSEQIFVAAALGSLRCTVCFADSRAEAFAILGATPISLVIVDGDAQAFSWREFLKQGPLAGKSSRPLVIVLSRFADDRMHAEIVNLGAYDLLPRPLMTDDLVWAVQSALSHMNNGCGPAMPGAVAERCQ
jgi:DNA-binding NtrC family response regulator